MLEDHAGTIAEAYALGRVVDFSGPVARGEQGEVWRLTTDRGVWAVKRSFGAFGPADAQRVGVYQRLARQSGVLAPVPVATPAGEFGHAVGGTLVRVQGWVDLLDADPMTDPAAVGAAVARLHRVHHPADEPPDPIFTEPVGATGWDEIVAAARRHRARFADRLAGYRDELLALEALLTPMVPVQTFHRDLWADNLRPTPDGELCVLDWDNCGPGDPSRELALVLFEFTRTGPERTGALYAAYRESGGPGRVRTPGDFSQLIAFLSQIGALQVRRWLDPALPDADRDRVLAWIEVFLAEPLDRSILETILSVTAEVS